MKFGDSADWSDHSPEDVLLDAKLTSKVPTTKHQTQTEMTKEKLPDLPDDSKLDTIYALPFFAQPGKHTYMIKYRNTKLSYVQRLQAKKRSLESSIA